jgi:hypothetical protein
MFDLLEIEFHGFFMYGTSGLMTWVMGFKSSRGLTLIFLWALRLFLFFLLSDYPDFMTQASGLTI